MMHNAERSILDQSYFAHLWSFPEDKFLEEQLLYWFKGYIFETCLPYLQIILPPAKCKNVLFFFFQHS